MLELYKKKYIRGISGHCFCDNNKYRGKIYKMPICSFRTMVLHRETNLYRYAGHLSF